MQAIKTILCAVDFSEHSVEVAKAAKYLAEKLDAEILAVYVAPSLSQYVGFHVPPNSIETFVGEIVQGAEKTMDNFVKDTFGDAAKVRGKVVTGYAAEEVLAVAQEEKVDLIVMGTHGRKGIDRMLFGSVAEKVVKSSTLPVLTIRPQA